jgi:hypothetical protein
MTTTARRKTTTEKGLGWRHRQAADTLKRRHTNGTPCDWCGRPMHLDRTRNYDYNPDTTNPTSGTLQADHSKISRTEAIRQGRPIPLPDRLLHAQCNRERGDGTNDHLSAATNATATATAKLLMPWP